MQGPAFTASAFYTFLVESKLMASRCQGCGRLFLPPRPYCGACARAAMEWARLSGTGTLVSFTAITVVPAAMAAEGHGRDNPYCTGIVQLDDGPRISARLLGIDPHGPETALLGSPVSFTSIRDGEGKVRPVVAFAVHAVP